MLSLIVPLKVNVGAAAEQDVSDLLAGLTAVVAPSVSVFDAVHDSVYVAGLEAVGDRAGHDQYRVTAAGIGGRRDRQRLAPPSCPAR